MGDWLRTCLGIGLAGWAALHGVPAAGGELADFMTSDHRLKAELRVSDGQHGVVGETGSLWLIDPSGAFQVASFVNQTVRLEREGALTGDELRSVAASLAEHDFADLPAAIGSKAPVNPRVIRVAFGQENEKTLLLPPGTTMELERLAAEHVAGGGPDAALLAIVGTILAVTAPD